MSQSIPVDIDMLKSKFGDEIVNSVISNVANAPQGDFVSFFLGYIWDDLTKIEKNHENVISGVFPMNEGANINDYITSLNDVQKIKTCLTTLNIPQDLQIRYFEQLIKDLNSYLLEL